MSLYKFFPKIPKITKSTSKEILNSASELIAPPAQASPSTTTENPIQITTETVIEKPQSEEKQSLTSRTSATELDISFEINKSSTSFGESEPLTNEFDTNFESFNVEKSVTNLANGLGNKKTGPCQPTFNY